jgi:nitrous oxidase accessory protein NosD
MAARAPKAPRLLALLTALGVLVGAGAWGFQSRDGNDPDRADRPAVAASDAAADVIPRPTTGVCDGQGIPGPADPPAGARVVRTKQHLADVVERARPGTTFWLEPGVHELSNGYYDNVEPKDGMTFMGAPGAVLDGRRRNAYAFIGKASGVTITHLTIRNFGKRGGNQNEGVVNHDAGSGWRIVANDIHDNAGAGVFIGNHNVVEGNCLRDNGQYGFSVYLPDGVDDVTLQDNEIVGNNTYDWESRVEGCGCSGGGKFWETSNARVVGNWIHDNHGVGLWADTNNTGFLIEGNRISGNASEGIIYETSYNAAIIHNVFARNGLKNGPSSRGFPTAAIYLSESGSDPRAGDLYGSELLIERNRFVDNWSGIVAWENADRFAGSPANSSTGATTLVNPGVATIEACSDPARVGTQPYIDDCRWKTQHLRVQHNTFRLDPSRLGAPCRPRHGCGFVVLASQWGSYPDWSPYQGAMVEEAITLHQDNVWSANRYVGPWRFQVKELWNMVGWDEWRAAPYGQDRGSSRRR